ncbi:MAG: class I SAM-dependent methyltransferase [Planctomycetales bacterium]|nr:class I SAM-dependent methyltransferase [Planctomycetales bacterium]
MNNPWLSIPAEEYEMHMAHPDVLQSQFLEEVFADGIRLSAPRSIALLGCATGNGLQHVDAEKVTRVTAVDLNLAYLAVARDRCAHRLPQLEFVESDILDCDFADGAFDLIHCALLLEYVDPVAALPKIARWMAPDGVLVIVLQLASPNAQPVSETGCESLKLLEPVMTLHEPDAIGMIAGESGLVESHREVRTLALDKRFYVGYFLRISS